MLSVVGTPARRRDGRLVPVPGPLPQTARAYCGPAHQTAWRSAEWPPPESAEVATATGTECYRLVHCPLTGVPARDRRGALVYVPAGP
ncbi:hypothetical protein [Modestobacter versicolor]|uniref:hypothetical protein n=1 Tax=Modestobacter versicolor TaxID=429133 RepID=UPI0034E04C5A